ncbi:hypothetical protein [Conexibacter woesei]|uniref:Uncharacterized protein n=1 Tax=Conexibacter woesei (strain DSM 14684 / CCUG 47730 / CIP 108061 / JCM 11494 / NBRC 100937 / ID131577) TaxID=469383 RepID=D3F1Z2_CONWI|nr:hypothetical protein [Conexibacter woesei]ADB50167.1 hypothetical protein Cwoe_1740 [Conexibacter woesei DSM 14684]
MSERDETAREAEETAVAVDSALAGLRRAYTRRRRAAELFLPVPGWDDPALVARVTVPDDQFVRRLTGEVGTPDWMASFVAETVAGLYEATGVDGDGERLLEPLPGVSGPLRFNAEFGAAIGAPDVNSPTAAVIAAFTTGGEGSFPVVNVIELADFADKIERWLSNTSREIAEAIVPGR